MAKQNRASLPWNVWVAIGFIVLSMVLEVIWVFSTGHTFLWLGGAALAVGVLMLASFGRKSRNK